MHLLNVTQMLEVFGGYTPPFEAPIGVSQECWIMVNMGAELYAQQYLAADVYKAMVCSLCTSAEKQIITDWKNNLKIN